MLKALIKKGSFITGALAFIVGASSFAIESSSEFTRMNLKVCNMNQTRCLNLTAEKGIGSSLGPLHSLENISMTLTDKVLHTEKLYTSQQGYLDLEFNRVVLSLPLVNGLKETTFDFKTLEPNVQVMK